nr:EAL domain-containing protein [uncultured Agathobacter sp.]
MADKRNRGRRITDRTMEAYYELMKIVAENNHERMFEYYVEDDEAYIFKIANSSPAQETVYPCFKQNIDTYMSECPADSIESFKKQLDKCLLRPMRTAFQLSFISEDGKSKPVEMYMVSIPDLNKKVCMVAGVMFDIRDEKGLLDSLTGTYNHLAFENKCTSLIRQKGTKLLFVMLDVDDFKIVNDTLGHNVGDRVLSQTGQVLKEAVGANGIVGRLGGDEFAAIVFGLEDSDAVDEFCVKLSGKLKNIIFDMEYSASIGMTTGDDRELTFKDLYYEADQAMYYSKRQGKNRISFFDSIRKNDVSIPHNSGALSHTGVSCKLSDMEIFSYDEMPDYILAVDEESRRIVFVNKAIRNSSVMTASQIDEFISKPFDDGFIDLFLRKKEQGNRVSVFSGKDHPDNIVAKLLGEKKLIVKLTHKDYNGYRLLKMIDLSNESKLNAVMRQISSYRSFMKNFIDAINDTTEGLGYKNHLRLIREFYNADCVAVIYNGESEWDTIEEIHIPSAQIMAKVVNESVSRGAIVDFLALFNDAGRVFISDIKSIEGEYRDLFKRMADVRIWSTSAVLLNKREQCFGAIAVMNPRANSGSLDLIDMVGISISNSLFYEKARAEYEYRLNFDQVTGLRKRETFNNLGESYVEYDCSSMGVFASDIIRLSDINDKFGYMAGNARLRMVANVISGVFTGYDIYRYEQDEIVVFCKDIDKKSFMGLVRIVRESLDDLDVSVSTGFSWTDKPDIARQLSEVRLMYDIEKDTKLKRLDSTMRNKVFKDVVSEIDNGSFMVYYQPKVDSRTGITVGAEALIRFFDEAHGIVGPIHFIEILEENRCSHLIDLFVLDEVCKAQKHRCINEKRVVPVSVNFSKNTLEYAGLLEQVKEIMNRYDLPEGLVQIEITESVGDMDVALINNIAQSLISMGFRLSMDDFGTKYSNLEMLFKFPFSIAKIDRSLVKNLESNEKSRIMLKHLISMIKELGIECVAEGAETVEQVRLLQRFGCNIIQGYFYSKPVTLDVFTSEFVEKTRNQL